MSNFKNRLDKLESITTQDRMIYIFALEGVITTVSKPYTAYVGKTINKLTVDHPHITFNLIDIILDKTGQYSTV